MPRVLAPSRLPSSISTEVELVKYRKMNGNLFYQYATPSNTLVATHGIDVSALEKSFAYFDGRLAMPSLAIGKRGQEGATHYRDILLIGGRNLVADPQDRTTYVYDMNIHASAAPLPKFGNRTMGRRFGVPIKPLSCTVRNVVNAMIASVVQEILMW